MNERKWTLGLYALAGVGSAVTLVGVGSLIGYVLFAVSACFR